MVKEKRLIELDTLIDNIDWDNDLQKWTLRGEPEDIPTIDAVEVVHGRWRKTYTCSGEWLWAYQCDQCNAENPRESYYCPNCGAKMDGKDNG